MPAGALAGDGQWVRLAHPAIDDFTPWQPWLELTFESSEDDLGVFSDLPLVTRSELIRSLRALS